MAMTPLATSPDLLDRGIDADADGVDALLESASAAVIEAAGAPIGAVDLDLGLISTHDQWLDVPLQPIRDVTAVTIDGVAVTDYKMLNGRLWRRCGWQNGCDPAEVVVSATFGYGEVPADIVDLVCSLVAGGLAAVADGYDPGRGIKSVRIDDYSESRTSGDEEVVNPMELPQGTRDMLRARFSGNVHVIGTY